MFPRISRRTALGNVRIQYSAALRKIVTIKTTPYSPSFLCWHIVFNKSSRKRHILINVWINEWHILLIPVYWCKRSACSHFWQCGQRSNCGSELNTCDGRTTLCNKWDLIIPIILYELINVSSNERKCSFWIFYIKNAILAKRTYTRTRMTHVVGILIRIQYI